MTKPAGEGPVESGQGLPGQEQVKEGAVSKQVKQGVFAGVVNWMRGEKNPSASKVDAVHIKVNSQEATKKTPQSEKQEYYSKLQDLTNAILELKPRVVAASDKKISDPKVREEIGNELLKLDSQRLHISVLMEKFKSSEDVEDYFATAFAQLEKVKAKISAYDQQKDWEKGLEAPIKMAETEGGEQVTLAGDWRRAKAGEGVTPTTHPEQYEADVHRQNIVIGGAEISKKNYNLEEADDIHRLCDDSGEAILELLRSSPKVQEMSSDKQQLLRYEFESISNQILPSYSNQQYAECQAHYMDTEKFKSKEGAKMGNIPGGKILECDFDSAANSATVSMLVGYEVRSLEGRGRTVLGYDGIRTTVTVDFGKITEDGLLATPGACSVKTEVSGFKKLPEEVDKRFKKDSSIEEEPDVPEVVIKYTSSEILQRQNEAGMKKEPETGGTDTEKPIESSSDISL